MPADAPAGPLRLLLLDFDGVIVESNDVKTEAFRDVFARFPEHADAMMAFHHANVSASRFVKFDHLVRERLGRPEDDGLRAELAEEFSRRTMDRVVACPLVPGAAEFLAEFGPRLPLYLASVTPAEDLDGILQRRGLRRWFRDVYGCPPWTKPDAARDVLRREGCAGDQALLVGDSPGDRLAAAASGLEFIARDSGIPFDPPMAARYPDLFAVAAAIRNRIAP